MTQVSGRADGSIEEAAARPDEHQALPRPTRERGTSLLSTARQVAGPERRRVALLVVMAVTAGLLEAAVLYLVARLATQASIGADDVVIGAGPFGPHRLELIDVTWITGGVLLLLLLVDVPLARLNARISERTLLRVRRKVADAYLHASWEARADEREGHLQLLLAEYAPRTERFMLQITTVAIAGCNLAVLGVVAAVVSPVAVLAIAACLGVLALVTRPLTRQSGAVGSRFAHVDLEYASRAAQTSRLAQEIAAFDVADPVARDLEAEATTSARALWRIRFVGRLTPVVYQIGALAVVVIVLGVLVSTGPRNLTGIGPVVLLLIRSLGHARLLQTATQAALEFAPYARTIAAECARYDARRASRTGLEVTSFERLCFERVTFSYVPDRPPVLDEVDLEIAFGEAIGLIGASGGGKSTLVQLLLGLRTPTAGRITIDGVDRRDIHPEALARLIAVVPQENRLIRATITDNIRFHRDLPFEAVEEAARLAHIHDEIVALPDGYDTLVGPGARDLSGGQKQRLGIARALVGRPSLLVLDEPTSALDSVSERLIKETLEQLVGTCSLLIVAHRPATLQLCHRVVSLEGGRLVERQPAPGAR